MQRGACHEAYLHYCEEERGQADAGSKRVQSLRKATFCSSRCNLVFCSMEAVAPAKKAQGNALRRIGAGKAEARPRSSSLEG